MRTILSILGLLFVMNNASAQSRSQSNNIITRMTDGIASFYHDKFVGKPTANGEVFDNNRFTAASNIHKLGTYVKVTNLSNGRVIYVKINDRMNKSNTRLIDLASIAAKELGFYRKGLTEVKVEIVPESEGKKAILAQYGTEERDPEHPEM